MTRPADQLDIASELEESERAHGTAKVRAALQAHGADECHDCGDTIPDGRRKAAPWATRCVYCQEALEAAEIRLVRGRLKFGGATASAPFPSAVVIFDASKFTGYPTFGVMSNK